MNKHNNITNKHLDKLLNIQELSSILSIKVSTIYRWVHEGYIPYYKVNHLVSFNESEIIEWIGKKKCNRRVSRVPDVGLN